MNPLTISIRDKTTPDYHPSFTFHSFINKAKNNNNIYTPLKSPVLKDYPGQFVYQVALEVRNPLGNINLSVEMLESLIKDKDLNMYLDVIKRNSVRMNNLINKFLTYQEGNEMQLEKV